MSKRRKGLSLEEKRQRLLEIYHESKAVYNLKEIEKLGSSAGIVLQTIKDVNQSLVDDNLLDFDKIGSGNYFWSFPSKYSQQRKRKLEELEKKYSMLQKRTDESLTEIEKQKNLRVETEERAENLKRLADMQERVKAQRETLQHFLDNDPQIVQDLEAKVKVMKDGADRWTDNIFNLKSWVTQKRGVSSAEADKWLGIKSDFDYVE